MDHAEGDSRINEGIEVVVKKEWQPFRRSNSSRSRSTVDTSSRNWRKLDLRGWRRKHVTISEEEQ